MIVHYESATATAVAAAAVVAVVVFVLDLAIYVAVVVAISLLFFFFRILSFHDVSACHNTLPNTVPTLSHLFFIVYM